MKLKVQKADPAGNITLFVLTNVAVEERAKIAAKLMEELKYLHIEQVGFIEESKSYDGKMSMMGGEFCGNATRAFGMLKAYEKGLKGKNTLIIETSGCHHPVKVEVNIEASKSYAQMPLPRSVTEKTVGDVKGTLVDLGGIAHFVVKDVEPTEEFFLKAERFLREIPELDAYGVIFVTGDHELTPLVKVPATNTLIWEGSCGSGTLAAVIVENYKKPEGTYLKEFKQPAGSVEASVTIENSKIVYASMGGNVVIEDTFEIEV